MQRTFRTLLLASATTFVVGVAQAQTSDIEVRIAALEQMVAELKAELAAEAQTRGDDIVRLDEEVRTVREGSPPVTTTGFRVGDTTLTYGGFVDFDAHVTSLSDGSIGSGSIARDFYIPGVTPVGGNETSFTDFTAEASRFFFDATRMVGEQKLTGHIELDFLGSVQGNERVSNSFAPRLRRAYLDYNGWRFGQEWSTFQNTSAIPESASFLVLSDGMVFIRQAQARLTNGNWQFALENGNTTVTAVAGDRIEADSNLVPDVVGRYNVTGDFGNISIAAIARQLRLENQTIDEETFGWGISASGRIKAGSSDDIRFNLVGGEGLGRYVGLNAANAAAIDPVDGNLEAIPSFGGLVAWRHPFGDTARFNVGYSGLWIDNPDFMAPGSTKQVQSAFGAVLWDVAPKLTAGIELLYGQRENEAGNSGDLARLTISTKYAF